MAKACVVGYLVGQGSLIAAHFFVAGIGWLLALTPTIVLLLIAGSLVVMMKILDLLPGGNDDNEVVGFELNEGNIDGKD